MGAREVGRLGLVGIPYGELYGEPGAVTTDETAQLATWHIPRSSPPPAPLAPPFVARGLMIDNATGRWFRVAGRWVAPWTVGARVPVEPPSSQLEVEAITPAGQLSEAVGEELVIVASSANLEPHPGIYTAPASGFSLRHARVGLTVTTSGGPPAAVQVVAAPAVGTRYGLRRLRATTAWDSRNRHSLSELVIGHLNLLAAVVGQATAVVSPTAPHAPEQTFDPPLVWADPSDAAVGDAGMHVLGQQWAMASPAGVIVDVDYLLLEVE
jgi:hypothetical protein